MVYQKYDIDWWCISLDGLILKPFWANEILYCGKRIEVRGSKTSKLEKVYVLESGTQLILGTVTFVKCEMATERSWYENMHLHHVNLSYEEVLKIYSKPYFWYINEVHVFDEPKRYVHPKGAVIWVRDVDGRMC